MRETKGTGRVKCAYADTSSGQIHYRFASGDGDAKPMVFLHQTASSSKMYLEVMSCLEGDNALFAIDTPGFGGSFDPEGRPSMPQYADWIVEAIDRIGIEDFHLFGHHTGVCIGAEIATKYAGRVLSFMMVGPVPLTQDEREEFRELYSAPFVPDKDGDYLKQTWDYLHGLGAHSDLALHHRELVDTVRAYMGRYQAYSAVWDQDFTELYKNLKAPLLIMCARDDALYSFFDRAKKLRPDAVAVELKGANFELDQDPVGVVAAIEKFLATVGTVRAK